MFSQSFQRLTSNGTPDGLNDDGTVRRQMAQELLPRVDAVIGKDTVGGLPVDTLRVLSYSPNQCGHCMCVCVLLVRTCVCDIHSSACATTTNGIIRSDVLNDAKNLGGDVLGKIINGTQNAASGAIDGAKNVAQDAALAVSGGVTTAVNKVQDVASNVGQGAGDAVNAVKDFFGGLFGRRRLLMDSIARCGYRACAPGSNEKAHVLYVLYKASTTGVADTTGLVPRFNVFQVNYVDTPTQGAVQTAQQLNQAWAAQYAAGVAGPLVSCAWVVDNSEFKAQMVCLDHGIKALGLAHVEELFVPRGLKLVGLKEGGEVGSVCGATGGLRLSGGEAKLGQFDSMKVQLC